MTHEDDLPSARRQADHQRRGLRDIKDPVYPLRCFGVGAAHTANSERSSKVPGNLGILIVETVEARRLDTTACSGEDPIAHENESLNAGPGRTHGHAPMRGNERPRPLYVPGRDVLAPYPLHDRHDVAVANSARVMGDPESADHITGSYTAASRPKTFLPRVLVQSIAKGLETAAPYLDQAAQRLKDRSDAHGASVTHEHTVEIWASHRAIVAEPDIPIPLMKIRFPGQGVGIREGSVRVPRPPNVAAVTVACWCSGHTARGSTSPTRPRSSMPNALLRQCPAPGCQGRGLPWCEKHSGNRDPGRDPRRSAALRGYDRWWRGVSKRHLQRYPLCGETPKGVQPTGDSQCMRSGRTTAAILVDHIVPHRGDERLRRDRTNRQSLCGACHNAKTQNETRARKAGGG